MIVTSEFDKSLVPVIYFKSFGGRRFTHSSAKEPRVDSHPNIPMVEITMGQYNVLGRLKGSTLVQSRHAHQRAGLEFFYL